MLCPVMDHWPLPALIPASFIKSADFRVVGQEESAAPVLSGLFPLGCVAVAVFVLFGFFFAPELFFSIEI